MAVNSTTWKKLPIAPRDTSFNADDAIARIRQWAGGSLEKLASAFLWRNSQAPANNMNSYRLPFVDISNGKMIMIPHAVFTAASILSGAHGGLEGTVTSEEERIALKRVVTEIYAKLQQMYGDRRLEAPWLKGRTEDERNAELKAMGISASMYPWLSLLSAQSDTSKTNQNSSGGLPTMLKPMDSGNPGQSSLAVNDKGWSSMPVDTDRPWNGDAATAALWSWADGDMRKYRQGFLWWDATKPDTKGAYKLPVAVPIDGTLTIVASAVTAVAEALRGAPASVDIPDTDQAAVETLVHKIQSRFDSHHNGGDQSVAAALFEGGNETLVYPPSQWFSNPNFEGPTPIAVTASGEVMGHMWLWNTCHAGIGDRCVVAPKSAVDYKFFKNGSVLTADGQTIKVGKITMGTGHADKNLGYVPAADHYDNTGTVIAVVASGEDRFGGWMHGSVVPEATPEQIQQLRRSPISGDWRRINGNLELVAALAVNTPGFPIVSLTASGEIDSLCAAGVLLEDGSVVADATVPLSEPDKVLLEDLAKLDAQWNKIRQDMRTQQLRTLLKKDVK